MNEKIYSDLKIKLINIANVGYNLEGLTRVILKCMKDGTDLKRTDIELLTIMLLDSIKNIREDINYVHRLFKI